MASKWDMQKKKEDRISAQQKKAKEQEKAKTQERAREIARLTGNSGPSLASSVRDPLALMRRDAQAGITTQDKIDMAKGSGAVTGNKTAVEASKKKTEETIKKQGEQKLSSYDKLNLSQGSQALIQAAKLKYDTAKAKNDAAGMKAAHQEAEAIRRRAGYSGGETGDEYISPELSFREKATLNDAGERRLKAARMDLNDAIASKDISRRQEAQAEVNRILQARGYKPTAESTTGHGMSVGAGATMTPGEFARRLDAGAKATAAGAMGSVVALGETAAQATNNRVLETNRAEVDRLANDLDLWKARLNLVQQGEGLPEWGSESYIQNRIKIAENAQKMRTAATTVDPNLPGQSAMRMARQWQQEATRGLSGAERLLANTAISGGQMLPAIAASFIPVAGPAIGAGIMGAQAAGSKAYDLTDRGIPAEEALTRGLTSGLIEGATERMGIGNLVRMVNRAGGASFLKNIAQQMGIEATEESVAYALNHAADVAYQDPEAKFSLKELAESAASGAILGGTFGSAGTVLNRALNRPAQTSQRPQISGQEALLQASGFYDRQAERAAESAQEAQDAQVLQSQAESLRQANQVLQSRLETSRQQLEQIRQVEQSAREQQGPDSSIESRIADRQRREDELLASYAQANQDGTLDDSSYQDFYREYQALQAEEFALTQESRQQAGQVSGNFGQAESHIDNRTAEAVGARNVKAFQFDHPQLHQYYAEAAQSLIQDAEYSFETQQAARGQGTIVRRSEPLQKAEDLGLTRNEIIKVCQDIIADKGQENYAAAKRVELVLDDMLSNGYIPNEGTTWADTKVPANQDYIRAKETIPGAVTGAEKYIRKNRLALELGEVTEAELRAEYEANTQPKETPGNINQRLVTAIRENHDAIAQAGVLASLSGNEFSQGNKRLSDQVAEFFASLGNKVTRLGFGDVALTKRGVKDSTMHGIGRNKAIAFSAVPAVIEDGIVIDEQTNWKGRGYDSVTFGGRIQINGIDYDMGVVVKKYDNPNAKGRYYLHEVVLTNKEGETVPIKTGTLSGDPSDTISSSELSVPPQTETVNNEYRVQPSDRLTERPQDTVAVPSIYNIIAQTSPEGNGQILPEGQGAMSRGGAGDFAAWQSETPGGQFHPINEQGAEMAAELYQRAPVEIPTRDPRGMLTSKTVSTLANAGITNNQLVQSLEADAVSGGYSYTAYSDPQAQTDAENYIREVGYQRAKEAWISDAKAGKLSKKNTALGLTLINNAANSGTLEGHIDAHDLIGYYVSYARTAGQALQAMNMVNKMSPTGQLYNLVKTAENLSLNIKDRSGKDVDLTIDPELSRQFMEAETQEARNAIKTEIYKDIARQIPNTFLDKANAWRYLAMLGNPRTHIRNLAGNLFFDPVRTTKNVIGTGLERLAGVEDRTKAVNTFTAEDRARYRAAQADFAEVQDVVMSGGKYNDDWGQIDEYRTIFNNPLLEGARKANAGALEAEDRFFSRRAYADSLAGWLKANGFTGEEYLSESFDPAERDRARQYAIKEAQKATYRDLNAASELVLSAGQLRNSQNKAKRAAGFFVEGVLPFKKTPTNILVRGLEYSPAGLTKGIADAATKVRRGEMEAAEAIDEIAAGLTGTGLLALGAGMAAAGLVSGGASGDDKQDEFNELQGHQNYALEAGDTSYTIDWLAPEALPFFVGVELQKFVSGLREGQTERKDWAKAVTRIAEPMLEMSMLQSLNDVINSVGSDVPLVSAVASAAMSYLGQFVPTLGGQIERTFLEDTRQSTYVDRDSAVPTSVQYMLGTIGNKIPGVDFYQREYVDAWGRPENTGTILNRALSNFFSPGYVSQINSTQVDQELQRLYDSGHDTVFPSMIQTNKQVADRASGQEDAKRYMTADEFNTMQTTRGQTAKGILDEAIQSESYRAMTDQEKAEMVEQVYDYAAAQGDLVVDPAKEVSSWISKTSSLNKETGIAVSALLEARTKANVYKGENAEEKTINYVDFVSDLTEKGYSKDQISAISEAYYEPNERAESYAAAVASGSVSIDSLKQFYSQSASYNEDGEGQLKQAEVVKALAAMNIPQSDRIAIYNAHGWKTSYSDALKLANKK